ncbi:hypothetical protein [Clostridium sp. AWRP]|nr:hypothetical protein [Clostridium sp. AWRP]
MFVEKVMNSSEPILNKLQKILWSKVDFAKQFSPQFITEELHN